MAIICKVSLAKYVVNTKKYSSIILGCSVNMH